jgi:hypothetical protein
MTVTQLKTKLLQQQEELKKALSKMSDVKREEAKKKYDFLKSFIGDPTKKLDTPSKILWSLLSIGLIGGAYMAFEVYQVDIGEAQLIAKEIAQLCGMDDATVNKKIRITGVEDGPDRYFVNVRIGGNNVNVKKESTGLVLDKTSVTGEKMSLNCEDLEDFVGPPKAQEDTKSNTFDESEFKTWWEGQGYEDYTNPVVSNGTITVKVGNDSYSYIKSGNGFVQPEE